ncbi:ammonium transporter [Stenotrophobium rhamnosiphilum]|uniref:Ammonium transporter n=1 Tax=Stenotrophobium rhamnosiphilum TaxID=2029166 RepID=A0A2T5MHH0_9GAMM|nr:ammonium transporter [Stenotrophobium rhamnosiphilum]PTU32013.1 ammonia channel protein [Stenotrophobium rhamnosiphilum]
MTMKRKYANWLLNVPFLVFALLWLPQNTWAQEIPADSPAVVEAAAIAQPPAAEPAAPPTRPFTVTADKINSGDTAWMLVSTALVLLMTIPGLALFYAGMVRRKNVLSTALQSFCITCLATVIWVVVGYSLAFTPGTGFIGGFDRVLLSGMSFIKETGTLTVSHIATTIPESVFVMFQMTFAIITPALITGAFAERIKFGAMVVFICLWSLFVYAPVAHWVWEPTGWLAALGAQDFAGGTVVHINAGAAGLMCAFVLGKRKGYGEDAFIPYNLAFTLIGASLLWVGWFGFNAGSAGAADGRAGMAMLVTQIAAATAALTWMLVEMFTRGRATLLGACSGAVAGLVAITPASGFVNVGGALAIGLAAGICCYWGATGLKHFLGADDSLDVFGIHCVGGLVGALLTGVFADKAIGGASGSVMVQAVGAFATLFYSAGVSLALLLIIDFTIGLRVTREDELQGLDLSQHSEQIG